MALDQETVLRALLQRRGMLLGYIESLVRDWHLAEDIFQEVSLLAIRKTAQIEQEAALWSWLRSTARFVALNALRKQQRRAETFDDATLDLLDEQWTAADEPEIREPLLLALRGCVEKLAPSARRMVQLRYYEGISGKTLAERMGKSLNTTYVGLTRIHRFLERCVRSEASRRLLADGE